MIDWTENDRAWNSEKYIIFCKHNRGLPDADDILYLLDEKMK